ncbi:MAG: hypothetical protein F2667_02365 [Actinobacteria bacterium]|uniref:Unannotated protein n=1 Tax=freshwater metagenome TaxID=449393 RepID=A0A6J6P4U0_9ZZZZ|nr:hypothetical protein [Actinomycetota bacterium]
MDSTRIALGSIVVGIDGSDASHEALAWAHEQALLEGRGLSLLHALAPLSGGVRASLISAGIDPVTLRVQTRQDARHLLEAARAVVADRSPDVDVATSLVELDAREALVDVSHDASLVVVGSRGLGPLLSLVMGSVSLSVAQRAACPVLVHRPHDGIRRGILVGVDGSPRSMPALEFAFRQASLRGEPLTVTHCFWDVAAQDAGLSEIRRVLAEMTGAMREKFPDVDWQVRLEHGLADVCLAQESDVADLVVIGRTHPRRHLPFLAPGVATAVLEHARSNVALVPDVG